MNLDRIPNIPPWLPHVIVFLMIVIGAVILAGA